MSGLRPFIVLDDLRLGSAALGGVGRTSRNESMFRPPNCVNLALHEYFALPTLNLVIIEVALILNTSWIDK